MNRPPQRFGGSRPTIDREEPDTPPSGTPYRESGGSEYSIVRDEQRDLRTRIGLVEDRLDESESRDRILEERVDKLEDWTEGSKVHKSTEEQAKQKRREKREERIWTVLLALLIAALIAASQWIHLSPPPGGTKVEVPK